MWLVQAVKKFKNILNITTQRNKFNTTPNLNIMSFEIINNKGVFEIHGHFTNAYTNQVADLFNNLLDRYYEITICLKHVKRMDSKALNVMQFITAKAKRRRKVLFVLGKDNKRIKKQFEKANLNDIFCNDYTS